MADLWMDYTLQTVLLGSIILGAISGMLGAIAVLRRQSLLGDALSHAALPGIALAFLLTGSLHPLVLLGGAAIAGWVATYVVSTLSAHRRLTYDSGLGIVLASFFGLGLMLLVVAQRRPAQGQAGLTTFLFGQAATLVRDDVVVIGAVALIILLCLLVGWNRFKLLAFDHTFGVTLGLSMRRTELLFTSLLTLAIVIGLQAVGVVLMSALLIAPGAAARQWTERFGPMLSLSALFGGMAGGAGAYVSSWSTKLPTGPVIVLVAGLVVIVSMLFAPNRGIILKMLQRIARRRRLRQQSVLLNLYALSQQHEAYSDPGHEYQVVRIMTGIIGGTRHNLRVLEERGLVRQLTGSRWAITPLGKERAEQLLHELQDGHIQGPAWQQGFL